MDPSHDASKVKAEGPGLARTGTSEVLPTHLPYCLSPTFNLFFLLLLFLPLLHSPAAGIESGKPTHFTVLTKGAGKAPLDVSFSEPVKDFDVIDNYDYSQTVKYTPSHQVSTDLLLQLTGVCMCNFVCVFQAGFKTFFSNPCDTELMWCVCPQGELTIVVKFGGDAIPKSPYAVGVAAPLDLNKVNLDNLDGSE